jgi:hypothetical protein
VVSITADTIAGRIVGAPPLKTEFIVWHKVVEPVIWVFRIASSAPNTVTWLPATPGGEKVGTKKAFQPLLQPPTRRAGSLPGPELVGIA